MEREVQMYPSDNFEYHKANAAGERTVKKLILQSDVESSGV